jgi:hypothetical protein
MSGTNETEKALDRPTRLMLVVAHPDDELIVFGPLLYGESRRNYSDVHVVLVTSPSPFRVERFLACADKLGFTCDVLGLPDQEGVNFIKEWDLTSRLSGIFERHAETSDLLIATHNPFSGDLGAHDHHVNVGVAVSCVADNLGWDEASPHRVVYRFFDGFCGQPIADTISDTATFQRYLDDLSEFYADQLPFLERAKYPISNVALFCTYDIRYLRSHALKYLGGPELTQFDFMLDSDPWLVGTVYEVRKSKWSAAFFGDFVLEFLASNAESVSLIDVGTGTGQTMIRVIDHVFTGSRDTSIKLRNRLRVTCVESSPAHRELLRPLCRELKKNKGGWAFSVREEVPAPGKVGTVVMSLMQCLYYFDDESFTALVEKACPDYIYIEAALQDWTAETLLRLGFARVSRSTQPFMAALVGEEAADPSLTSLATEVGFFDAQECSIWTNRTGGK